MISTPLYADLRKREFRPRVHPNGFIQLNLDVTGNLRLHVWPDDDRVSGQDSDHPIHDHIFDMHSIVLCGGLIQRVYTATLTPKALAGHFYFTHEIHIANYSKAHESTLDPTGVKVNLDPPEDKQICARAEYVQGAGTFHESIPAEGQLTATLMHKYNVYQGIPRILVPIGISVDNDFVREEAYDDELLWEYIERALELAWVP